MKIDGKTYTKSIFSKQWTPAMEAPEDLTATTNDMMRRATNSRNAPGGFEPTRTSDETRQEDGGNVQENPNSMSDDMSSLTPDNAPADAGSDMPQDDAGGMGDDMGTGGDDMGMDDMGGDDMGGNDMSGGDMGGGMGEGTPKETPEQAQNIVALQNRMSMFYKVLENTIEALSNYTAPASTVELQNLYTSSINHLTSAKESLRDLLVTDFLPSNYAYKLRRYVVLRHVYSTVLEVLDLHFKVLKQEVEAKNPNFT